MSSKLGVLSASSVLRCSFCGSAEDLEATHQILTLLFVPLGPRGVSSFNWWGACIIWMRSIPVVWGMLQDFKVSEMALTGRVKMLMDSISTLVMFLLLIPVVSCGFICSSFCSISSAACFVPPGLDHRS